MLVQILDGVFDRHVGYNVEVSHVEFSTGEVSVEGAETELVEQRHLNRHGIKMRTDHQRHLPQKTARTTPRTYASSIPSTPTH